VTENIITLFTSDPGRRKHARKKKKREYKIDFHSKNERMTHQMALLNKKFTFTGK